jgi:hypothetical protein
MAEASETIHQWLAEVAKSAMEEYNVRITRVEFDWTSIDKIGEPSTPHLRSVSAWTQTEADL